MHSARNWPSQCSGAHSKCKAPRSARDASFLPTRIVEIGQPEPHKVRLRLSSDQLDATSGYATLSHCWGKAKVLKLKSVSFRALRTGIAIAELGQTFQDAIFTARSLDISLLWIDSLCIFQDSKVDWQHESALMGQVYSNGILNIAASIAVDSDASCFPERPSSSLDPYFVQTDWDQFENGTYLLYKRVVWENTIGGTPLTKRAWVIQETCLAPRVLYLCGSQIFWQCYDLRACERFPKGASLVPPTYSVGSQISHRLDYLEALDSEFWFARPDTLYEALGNSEELIPIRRLTQDSKHALWQL